MKNGRSGGAFVLVLVTLLLCACVTMGLAVFIINEETSRYKEMVPYLLKEFEVLKEESDEMERDLRNQERELARLKKLLEDEKTINSELEKKKPYPNAYLLEIQKKISPFFDLCRVR